MAEIRPLIALSDLKQTLLDSLVKERRLHPIVKYEEDFDAIIINFGPPTADPVVYYLDERIGLLFDENTLEIIGFQIENFERYFVSTHSNIRHVWHDTTETATDVGDMMIIVETKVANVRRELAKALQDEFPKQEQDLLKALA